MCHAGRLAAKSRRAWVVFWTWDHPDWAKSEPVVGLLPWRWGRVRVGSYLEATYAAEDVAGQ